jgi:hypothetical protein
MPIESVEESISSMKLTARGASVEVRQLIPVLSGPREHENTGKCGTCA